MRLLELELYACECKLRISKTWKDLDTKGVASHKLIEDNYAPATILNICKALNEMGIFGSHLTSFSSTLADGVTNTSTRAASVEVLAAVADSTSAFAACSSTCKHMYRVHISRKGKAVIIFADTRSGKTKALEEILCSN